jgi:PKD repeat protein
VWKVIFGGSEGNRTFLLVPHSEVSGTNTVKIRASDGEFTAERSFSLTVNPLQNTAPTISAVADRTVAMNSSTGPIPFTIGDGETGPEWLDVRFDCDDWELVSWDGFKFGGSGASRTVTFTPEPNKTGSATVELSVSDGKQLASTAFILTVIENGPPVIDSPPTADPNPVEAGRLVSFAVAASDPEGDPLSFAWDFGDGATGSGETPGHAYAAAGTYTATVTVSDPHGGTASASVTVSVLRPHDPGDLNRDGSVNVDDLVLVTGHFGQTSDDPVWDPAADANGDGAVSIEDLTEVTSNFGKTYP